MEIVKSFGKYTIKQIFFDHWEEYLKKNLMWLSPHIVDEVERMLACRDPLKSGYHMYACPEHPLEKVYVPHSCKSRFCNVCGVNQTNKWMNEATSYFPNCGYFRDCQEKCVWLINYFKIFIPCNGIFLESFLFKFFNYHKDIV